MRHCLMGILFLLGSVGVAQAQVASCPNGVVSLYGVHIGTGACDVASGAALANEITQRQAVTSPSALTSALSLGTMSKQNATSVNITGGTLTGDGTSTVSGASNIITSPTISNPAITGGTIDQTATITALPNGASIPNTLSSILGRVVDLNDYAPTSISGTDGTVAGTAFTTTTTSLASCPVGSALLIRGAGTAGISFQTTVAASISTHALTLASAAPTAVTGTFYCGMDATAGVTAAYAVAQSRHASVRGRGAFWLAGQTTPITLSGTSTVSDGGPVSGFMPYTGGLTFLVTNPTVSPFNPGTGATFGASVFYPAQDGSAVTPLTYPAIFDVPNGGLITNFNISGATFVNPYILLSVEPNGGGGRIFVNNTRAFCISRCFDIRNGLADTIQTTSTDYFGPGVYGDIAPAGNAYLAKYSAANGELFHLDPASPGNNYAYVDGLLIDGGMVQQMRYAIRLVSGTLDVSKVSGLDLDSTPTALSVEGTATASLSWNGGLIYSSQSFTPTANNNVFNFTSTTNSSTLTLTGAHIPFAQGNVVRDGATGLNVLVMTGNYLGNFGLTTSTAAATYYAFAAAGNIAQNLTITGNAVVCNVSAGSGNVSDGLLIQGASAYTVGMNTFSGCTLPINSIASAGAGSVIGNTTTNTLGPKSMQTTLSGSASIIPAASSLSTLNNFDKP